MKCSDGNATGVRKVNVKDEQMVRHLREMRDRFDDYWWQPRRDVLDMYDLRYLFEDEEVKIELECLLQANDYWSAMKFYAGDEDEEEDDGQAWIPPDGEDEEEAEVLPDENWDEDEYHVRFIYGRGFVSDGYDSGVDEPNLLRVPYPESEGEDVDEEEQQQLVRKLRELHSRRISRKS